MKRKIHKMVSGAKQGFFALALVATSGLTYSQVTYTFAYTGNIQTVNLSAGDYLVELWGADGGNNMAPNTGGIGGYATGTLNVVAFAPYYIGVGGKGITGIGGQPSAAGGFNGGGNAGAYTSSAYGMGSGGGASHIAKAPGILSSLSGNQSDVAIVAGGGGGSGSNNGASNLINKGGHGGGLTGGNGQSLNSTYGGYGGTQTAGGFGNMGNGSFGQGGNNSGNNTGAGGGGGWYGGGAAQWEGSGGGSSYIGGVNNGATGMFGTTGFVTNPMNTNSTNTYDGYVVITQLCAPPAPPVSLNSFQDLIICGIGGGITTLSVTGTGNLHWYNVPFGGTALDSGDVFVTPFVTTDTVFYAAATTSCSSDRTAFHLTVLPKPSVSIITSTNAVCPGTPVSLIASGNAATYTWTQGGSNSNNIMVSPAVNTTYELKGRAVNGCTNSATQHITIHTVPTLVASTERTQICKDEVVKLSVTGNAQNYTWASKNLYATGTEVYANPKSTTVYTVTGTNEFGCTHITTLEQKVFDCTSLRELKDESLGLSVYPNPNNGAFTIELNNVSEKTIELLDLTGRIVFSNTTSQNVINMDIQNLANGIYYLKVKSNTGVETAKIVKQ